MRVSAIAAASPMLSSGQGIKKRMSAAFRLNWSSSGRELSSTIRSGSNPDRMRVIHPMVPLGSNAGLGCGAEFVMILARKVYGHDPTHVVLVIAGEHEAEGPGRLEDILADAGQQETSKVRGRLLQTAFLGAVRDDAGYGRGILTISSL